MFCARSASAVSFERPRSVMTQCTAEGGTMRERLRRLNFVESQTATTRREAFTMARLTRDSRKFGVVSPTSGSNPSTPRKRMSACISSSTSSASGPTSEKEFLRRLPPIRMTSRFVLASSAAMFTALVITVS